MFVKPKKGLSVFNPETKKIMPDTGMLVVDNAYWQRRVIDGDVILTEDTEAEPKAKK